MTLTSIKRHTWRAFILMALSAKHQAHCVWLYLWSLFRPLRITLYGSDNTISINKSLYQMLAHLGINDNNRIYSFHIEDNRYGFCILPPLLSGVDTFFSPLRYDHESRTIGFEMLCPTIQSIFYRWNLPPESIINTTCSVFYYSRERRTDTFVFVINPPSS